MNLLEHFIKEIIKEEKVYKGGKNYYHVVATVVCWGAKEQIDKVFPADEWDRIKACGYFVG